jgi:hypothetical protein
MAEQAVTLLARRRDVRPLTAGFLQQQIWSFFRERIGEHRAEAMIRHLRSSRRLLQVGSYKSKRHGFHVPIYRLAQPAGSVTSSVRKNSRVKPRAWWQHPLFGTPDGKPPPGTSERQKLWWQSGLWRKGERSWEREAGVVHSFKLA